MYVITYIYIYTSSMYDPPQNWVVKQKTWYWRWFAYIGFGKNGNSLNWPPPNCGWWNDVFNSLFLELVSYCWWKKILHQHPPNAQPLQEIRLYHQGIFDHHCTYFNGGVGMTLMKTCSFAGFGGTLNWSKKERIWGGRIRLRSVPENCSKTINLVTVVEFFFWRVNLIMWQSSEIAWALCIYSYTRVYRYKHFVFIYAYICIFL